MQLVEALCLRFNVTRHQSAYLRIQDILKLYAELTSHDVPAILQDAVQRNTNAYKLTQALHLPPLIINSNDIYDFSLTCATPNFITLRKIMADIIVSPGDAGQKLKGKIICIPSADPGFDWLFTHQIGGLITQYGGANSHMAIRAAELGIPAVIGCGAQYYSQWTSAKTPITRLQCKTGYMPVIIR